MTVRRHFQVALYADARTVDICTNRRPPMDSLVSESIRVAPYAREPSQRVVRRLRAIDRPSIVTRACCPSLRSLACVHGRFDLLAALDRTPSARTEKRERSLATANANTRGSSEKRELSFAAASKLLRSSLRGTLTFGADPCYPDDSHCPSWRRKRDLNVTRMYAAATVVAFFARGTLAA